MKKKYLKNRSVRVYMDLDFIEIGTSNFDTLLQTCSPNEIGISIEPIQYYLDTLPTKPNVKKVHTAITANRTTETIDIYFIPEPLLQQLDLPWWLKGCNKVGDYHPLHKEYKLEEYVIIDTAPLLNIDEFLINNNIRQIKFLKIDTEGHDTIILGGLFAYLKSKSKDYYPRKILFESNANTTKEDLETTLTIAQSMGYTILTQTSEDTTLILDEPGFTLSETTQSVHHTIQPTSPQNPTDTLGFVENTNGVLDGPQ